MTVTASRLDGADPGRRAYSQPFRRRTWRGWTPDTAPARTLPPRCGEVLALDGRYERGGIPGDPGDPPRCGRPESHNGPCRSRESIARAHRASLARQAARRAQRAAARAAA